MRGPYGRNKGVPFCAVTGWPSELARRSKQTARAALGHDAMAMNKAHTRSRIGRAGPLPRARREEIDEVIEVRRQQQRRI